MRPIAAVTAVAASSAAALVVSATAAHGVIDFGEVTADLYIDCAAPWDYPGHYQVRVELTKPAGPEAALTVGTLMWGDGGIVPADVTEWTFKDSMAMQEGMSEEISVWLDDIEVDRETITVNCEGAPIQLGQPPAPTFTDVCGGSGADSYTYTKPENTAQYYYGESGEDDFNDFAIEAIARPGYEFAPGVTTRWDFGGYTDEPCPEAVTVYRFWSDSQKSHFYTASLAERDAILRTYSVTDWRYEGAAYSAFGVQQASTTPLYRFWSNLYRGHFYTTSLTERDVVVANYTDDEWLYEGIAFYVYPTSPVVSDSDAVARFWSQQNRHHFYTSDAAEAEYVKGNYPSHVWSFEGDNFRVPSATPDPAPMINAKDCGDFPNWSQANSWFRFYHPRYGDVAQLDADNDMIPCELLPGAP